jgi:D-alanyl-D-alanine carboxypeptidase
MKILVFLVLLAAGPAWAETADSLCSSNPAFAPDVMLRVVQVELQGDHDPSLDADTPEHIASQASTQGIAECAAEVRTDPSIASALGAMKGADLQAGWDAYNTVCTDKRVSRGACISAEVNAGKALKQMTKDDEPAGAKTLVQTCTLVMKADRGNAEWKQCVDMGLAVRASGSAAKRCKMSATWHVAETGAQAGEIIANCLRGG